MKYPILLACSSALDVAIYNVNEQLKQRKLRRLKLLRYLVRTICGLSCIHTIIETIQKLLG